MRCPLRGLQILIPLTLLLAPRAAAQPLPLGAPATIEVPGTGTEVFRGLLDRAGVKPVKAAELRQLDRGQGQYDDTMVIILGTQPVGRGVWNDPRMYADRVLRAGGQVLIACDRPAEFNSMGFSVQFSGTPVVCLNEDSTHPAPESREYCPYVAPVTIHNDQSSLWKLFHSSDRQQQVTQLKRVTTNSPTYITTFQHNWPTLVARFPDGSFATDGRRSWALPPGACFAVGAEMGVNFGRDSRFLAMADHSVFINQMLLEPGTENLEFTYRVIEYLQGPNKQTKRCIFFEDGRHVESFDDLRQAAAKQNQTPLPQVNLWAMQDKLTDLGNTIFDRLQTNDAHNQLLLGSSRNSEAQHRTLAAIMRFFLILLTIFGCWFVLRRVWAARKPTDIPPAPAVAGAPSGPPGVFDRRQKELLRRNNLYEPVRDLVREFFESIGIHGEQTARLPKLMISDVVRRPDSLRTAIKDFWRLAFGPPQVLTVTRWRELEPYFERLRQAHADGKWRFVLSEATAGSVA
jgi:hypothetical protein